MRWMTCFALAALLLGSAIPAGAANPTPEPAPDAFSPTARALYALTYAAGDGISVGDFKRAVPQFGTLHSPADVTAACERLGFLAFLQRVSWNKLFFLDTVFLAPGEDGHWSLYRAWKNVLSRLEGPSLEEVPVPPGEFLDGWNREIITVVRAVPPGGGTPEIHFAHTEHDFGEIKEGIKVDHIFPFESVGSATLEIVNVHPGCGCSAVTIGLVPGNGPVGEADIQWGVKSFPPGTRGAARFIYNSKSRRGPTGSYADISTNAPANRQVRIKITAQVVVPVDVAPNMVSFGNITIGSHPAQDIAIKAVEDASFRILDATVSDPNLRLELSKNDAAGPEAVGYTLHVSLDTERLKTGERINDKIRMRTTSKWKPVIEIPVSAMVKPPVYALPDVVRLVQRQRGADPSGFLIVISDAARNVEVTDVTSSLPNLSFQTRTLGNGRYQIAATLKPDDPSRSESGTITVRTTDADTKEIEVPVTYTPIRRP